MNVTSICLNDLHVLVPKSCRRKLRTDACIGQVLKTNLESTAAATAFGQTRTAPSEWSALMYDFRTEITSVGVKQNH